MIRSVFLCRSACSSVKRSTDPRPAPQRIRTRDSRQHTLTVTHTDTHAVTHLARESRPGAEKRTKKSRAPAHRRPQIYIILKFNLSSARDADVRVWRSVALLSLAATMPVAAAPRLALAPAAAVARWVAAEDLVDSDAHEVPVAVWLEQLLRGGEGAGGGARWGACAARCAAVALEPPSQCTPPPSPRGSATPGHPTPRRAAPRRATPGASPAAA